MREVELGGGNTTDFGRGNTTDLGRGNTTDLGRGNTLDFGRQVSTGESRPLKKSDGSPESKTSPSYGPSVREPQKTLEINRRASSAIAEVTGPFCHVFQAVGVWYLTGGTVTGGDTNVTIPDIDLGTVDTPPADGTHFWIEADGDAVVEDEVLLPGFNLSTAVVSSGASVPTANVIPTASAEAGTLYISLGAWSGGVFIPAGCGNIQINHCPGSLTFSRGTTFEEFY